MPQFPIVPTHLVVKAMRDNGYKNAAYAIAELMDNSIQSQASIVELICVEVEELRLQRKRSHINQIAVLDNGCGMDSETLRMALQFGNGKYLDTKDPNSMGRFGMGLPNSSISQCRRVEVWSWQNGIDKALYTYIDIEEIEKQKLDEVPAPKLVKIPEVWIKMGNNLGKSGTLVLWSKIDRCMWKTGKTIIENSEFLIGRMYRRFLNRNAVKINFKVFDINNSETPIFSGSAKPNDPMYLTKGTSCPEPYNQNAMFQIWGEPVEYKIRFNGENHSVKVTYSYAQEDARRGHNPGERSYGKHAAKNVGVSIVRANRELDLDPTWSDPSEPRDRWWGVELDFPPALDDLFGVTNNKQSARHFSDLAKVDLESMLEDGQTIGELKENLDADSDPRLPLLEIVNHIRTNINQMRALIKAQTAAAKQRRDKGSSPEEVATEATQKRKEQGFAGASDKQESLPSDERRNEIESTLIQQGITQQTAIELAASTIARGIKYTFARASLDTSAFFNVMSRGGVIIITLNTSHPAYNNVMEVLDDEVENVDIETLRERLNKARDGLQLLLMAWARYEDEQPEGLRKNTAQDARSDWGRVARQFLDGE